MTESPAGSPALLQFGGGNMGGAMLTGWLAGGFDPARITLVDPFLAAAPTGVTLLREPPADTAAFDVVVLAFKPQQLAQAAGAIRPLVAPHTLLLSILAGVDCATLRDVFPEALARVRVMPNLAAAIGKSPIALVGDAAAAAPALRSRVAALMAPLGQAEWLDDEAAMDLVTALAGSGPAFVYRLIDTLAQGAAALGLPADQAERLAVAMTEGAAALAASARSGAGIGPGELARRVASPGGVTQAGLNVLDADAALLQLVTATLRAARDRSQVMTANARADARSA